MLDGAVCVAAAQYRLGMLYLERRDIAHAVDTGLGWLTKAADNGHAEATYTLGYIYANGSYGVVRDITKASQLIESYKNQPDKLDPKAQERLRYVLSLCLDTNGGLNKCPPRYHLAKTGIQKVRQGESCRACFADVDS